MKLIVNLIFFCSICYVLILAAFYFFQEKLLFFPGTRPFGDCPGMEKRNAGAQNHGNIRYYFQAVTNPGSWIIVFHGNAGNACERTYFLDFLKDFNANLVVFEYPGYGRDSNAPGQALILKQAHELVSHIIKKNHEDLPVYLMGESLGTGVATWVATRTDVNGLILISAYPSLALVGRYHYPWLPVKVLLKHPFQADIWASQTRTPALLFHGVNDTIIPVLFGRQQALNFKGDKNLVEISSCGHNDIMDVGKIRIQKEIHDFISKTSF